MKTIYLDEDFRCHLTQQEPSWTAVETAAFDGKCASYIEGCRFVPAGKTWVRWDGEEFAGEMVSPWKLWTDLDEAQREYERQLVAQYEAALQEIEEALGV